MRTPIDEVVLAVEDLKKILHPPRRTDPELDVVFRNRARRHVWIYINPDLGTMSKWQVRRSRQLIISKKGPVHAQKLCQWVGVYTEDREDLPVNPYGQVE